MNPGPLGFSPGRVGGRWSPGGPIRNMSMILSLFGLELINSIISLRSHSNFLSNEDSKVGLGLGSNFSFFFFKFLYILYAIDVAMPAIRNVAGRGLFI